jgi:hypothetical protein
MIRALLVGVLVAVIGLGPSAWAAPCTAISGNAVTCADDHRIVDSQASHHNVVLPNATKTLTGDSTTTITQTDIGTTGTGTGVIPITGSDGKINVAITPSTIGTGTKNQLAKYTSTVTGTTTATAYDVGSSGVSDDGSAVSIGTETNRTLGIGTIAPAAPLHIKGAGITDTSHPGFLFERGDSTRRFRLQFYHQLWAYLANNYRRNQSDGLWYADEAASGGSILSIGADGGFLFGTVPAGYSGDWVGGTPNYLRLKIDNAGDVWTYKNLYSVGVLSVAYGVGNGEIRVYQSAGGIGLSFICDNTTAHKCGLQRGTSYLFAYDTSVGDTLLDTGYASGVMKFSKMGVEKLRIDASEVLASQTLRSTGAVVASETYGFQNRVYTGNAANPIWSFANATTYGLSYYQYSGTPTISWPVSLASDAIGFHFGTKSAPTFYVTSAGKLYLKAGGYSDGGNLTVNNGNLVTTGNTSGGAEISSASETTTNYPYISFVRKCGTAASPANCSGTGYYVGAFPFWIWGPAGAVLAGGFNLQVGGFTAGNYPSGAKFVVGLADEVGGTKDVAAFKKDGLEVAGYATAQTNLVYCTGGLACTGQTGTGTGTATGSSTSTATGVRVLQGVAITISNTASATASHVLVLPHATKTVTATSTITQTDIGTATPTASEIPIAGTDNKLDNGWLSTSVNTGTGSNHYIAMFYTGTGTATTTTARMAVSNLHQDPNGYVLPTGDGAVDLGNSNNRFKNGFFNGTLQVDTTLYLPTDSAIQGHLIPTYNNQANIGSTSYRWKDLFLSGGANIAGNLTLGANVVGDIVPSAASTNYLGSDANPYARLYVDAVYKSGRSIGSSSFVTSEGEAVMAASDLSGQTGTWTTLASWSVPGTTETVQIHIEADAVVFSPATNGCTIRLYWGGTTMRETIATVPTNYTVPMHIGITTNIIRGTTVYFQISSNSATYCAVLGASGGSSNHAEFRYTVMN